MSKDVNHKSMIESRSDMLKKLSEIYVKNESVELNKLITKLEEMPESLWSLMICSNIHVQLYGLFNNYRGVEYGLSPEDHALSSIEQIDRALEALMIAYLDPKVDQYVKNYNKKGKRK